jgi:peroxiredoxin
VNRNLFDLPAGLPVPADDGAADHLRGAPLADLTMESTSGERVRLADLTEPAVLFFYPRTGVPDQHLGAGFRGEAWDAIPGARGCTPQNCGFRDAYGDFAAMGVAVYGVSTQTTAFQQEFKLRNGTPFDYLSDDRLALVRAMQLPAFEFPVRSGGPTTLIKRMSWFVTGGRIEHVWYPVFPPNENAALVLEWLRARGVSAARR